MNKQKIEELKKEREDLYDQLNEISQEFAADYLFDGFVRDLDGSIQEFADNRVDVYYTALDEFEENASSDIFNKYFPEAKENISLENCETYDNLKYEIIRIIEYLYFEDEVYQNYQELEKINSINNEIEELQVEETPYQKGKEKVRQQAINWQLDYSNHNYSYSELAEFEEYFEKMGKKYGLIKEFKENGII